MSELYVSVSPHIRSPRTTQTIMRDVLIALCPALIASCVIFGMRALLVIVVCVAASVLFEFLYQKGTKQPITISDCSAAVTGMILAMNLPVTIPLWQRRPRRGRPSWSCCRRRPGTGPHGRRWPGLRSSCPGRRRAA